MPLFGSSPPPSYAQEQLNHSLTALSTIPISIPVSVVGQHGGVTSNTSNTTHEDNTGLSTTIERVLGELSTSKPITRRQIEQSLETLVNQASAASVAPVDKVREAQIMARAVTVVWKESMQALVDESVRIEYAIEWWESTLQSGLQVAVYLIQTLPIRIWRLVPHPLRQSAFRIPSRNSLHLSHLFPTHHSTKHASSLRDLPLPAHNPLVLTRREILGSLKSLQSVRSEIAQRVGLLATGAPRWVEEASKTSLEQSQDNLQVVVAETNRLYALVVEAVGSSSNNSNNNQNGNSSNSNNNNQSIAKASPTPSPLATPTAKRSRREREVVSPPPPPTPLSATTLLPLLRDQLPETISSLSHPVLDAHSPPSRLVRLWVPMLLIPPLIHYSARSALVHKDWISSQLVNAGTTIRGWLVGWVIEPLSGVVATLQRGGQGLGVAPESVACDGASLERMVVDLGKDYYHLDQAQLDHLVSQVKQGDMEQVLKAYETEIKSPLRNALMGSLVRTLLIQVQKTKYDLSLSLLSLDHLLKSQQLTFAFVGLAPSLLVLYGLSGWAHRVWTGEKRGKNRRREWLVGVRRIEKLLLTSAPPPPPSSSLPNSLSSTSTHGSSPQSSTEMSNKDRGLLILASGKMRTWAAGLRLADRQAFLDDLQLIEMPALDRTDKLRVIDRIWRTEVVKKK